MEPGVEGRGRSTGIGPPLIGSAAGHLALLTCFLLWGASAGPGVQGVVQVVLVEGTTGAVSAGEAVPPASPPPPFPPAWEDLPAAPSPTVVGDPSASGPAQRSPGLAVRGGTGEPVPAPAGASGRAHETSPRDARVPGSGGMLAVLPPAGTVGGGSGWREGAEIRLLRERIESRIVYPEEAIRRGQEGEVLLRIRVGEEGIPKDIRVTRSSGARALDEAARSGVVRAAPLPSTPGWFEVPVRFHLR